MEVYPGDIVFTSSGAEYCHLRLALLRTDIITKRVAEVTQRYGFPDPSEFVRAYENAFGAVPHIGPLHAAVNIRL